MKNIFKLFFILFYFIYNHIIVYSLIKDRGEILYTENKKKKILLIAYSQEKIQNTKDMFTNILLPDDLHKI